MSRYDGTVTSVTARLKLTHTHTHTHVHRDRDTDTHAHTQAHTQRQRQVHTHTHTERDTQTQRDTHTRTQRQRHRHTHTHRETHTDTERHTHTHRHRHRQSNYYKHQLLTAMCSLKCYEYKFCSVQKFGVNEMFSCFWHLFCSPTLHLFAQKCSKALKYSRNILWKMSCMFFFHIHK